MNDLQIIAKSALKLLTEGGAEMAYVTAAESQTEELNADNGKFSLYRTLYGQNLSLVAIKGGKRGIFNCNALDEATVTAAVAQCLALAESGHPDDAWGLAPCKEARSFFHGVTEPDMEAFFARTQEFLFDVQEKYPTVELNQVINTFHRQHKVYCNTVGACYETQSGGYGISLMFCAREGEKTSSFSGLDLGCTTLDRPFLALDGVEAQIEAATRQVHTQALQGSFVGTALLMPPCFGELLSSAIDSFASGMSIMQGTAKWADSLGEQVASPQLTVSYAPHHEAVIAGQDYTAEGFLTEDETVIRQGVLEACRTNLYTHRKTGKPLSKNTDDSLVVEAGDASLSKIIAGIERGILVGRFSGGSPASNGDFSGVAKNSFLIEKGRVTCALAETMISGNLADMLMHVTAISKERFADGCTLLPYVACEGITVSGN